MYPEFIKTEEEYQKILEHKTLVRISCSQTRQRSKNGEAKAENTENFIERSGEKMGRNGEVLGGKAETQTITER